MGSGQSKKKAKHTAAKAVLEKLWGSSSPAAIERQLNGNGYAIRLVFIKIVRVLKRQ